MLRHAKDDMVMCRKPIGVHEGYVCHQHEGRCVICDVQFDEILPTMRPVLLCDDCGFGAHEGGLKCVMCGSHKTSEQAYYCQYCVALEKDRDGCPRVFNLSRQQRIQALRGGVSAG